MEGCPAAPPTCLRCPRRFGREPQEAVTGSISCSATRPAPSRSWCSRCSSESSHPLVAGQPAGDQGVRPQVSRHRALESRHREVRRAWCRSSARLVTSFIALLIGIPVSFGIALFLTELSPIWLRRPLGTAIELLAAIPSIIYGMWGCSCLPRLRRLRAADADRNVWARFRSLGMLFQGPPMGIGILTAGLILAIMVIPFIASVMRDVFEIVPAVLEGIRLRARLDDLGGRLERRCCRTRRSAWWAE